MRCAGSPRDRWPANANTQWAGRCRNRETSRQPLGFSGTWLATLRKNDGVFGGELAGHYYFKDNYYADCAVLAGLHGWDPENCEPDAVWALRETLEARPWVEWSIHERRLPGAHMHDPLTVAMVIEPSFCRLTSMDLSVPALLTGKGPWLTVDSGGLPVKVVSQVDAPRFEAWLADRLHAPVLEHYLAPAASNAL